MPGMRIAIVSILLPDGPAIAAAIWRVHAALGRHQLHLRRRVHALQLNH
jgi:hypothetical protein